MATLTVGIGGFTTIQAAIDASGNGDTIIVADGTYVEQLTIAGKTGLTIEAASGAVVTVTAPAVLAVNGFSDHFSDNVRAVIGVTGSTDVVLKNITVDGSFAGDTTPGSNGDELTGIAYLVSTGTINGVTVQNVSNSTSGGLFGLQHGSGILIDGAGDSAVDVIGSTITDFQKTGIIVVNAISNLTGNTITGIGATALTAQNGIQFGKAQGSIVGNTISGLGYSGGVWSSSGIIAYEPTGPLAIESNTLEGEGAAGSFVGIDLSDTGTIAVIFTANTVTNADYGIYAYTFTGGTIGLATAPVIDISNSFLGIAIEALRIAPEESFGAAFTTTNPFDLTGSTGVDYLAGSLGDDSLDGDEGNDTLMGNGGKDKLLGGLGNDLLNGGEGNDSMTGGLGDDTFVVDNRLDKVVEADGGGTDTVMAATAGYVIGANVENLTFARTGANRGVGNALDNVITGNTGADDFRGLAGNDSLFGLGGNDSLAGGDGNDRLDGGVGADRMNGGAGNDLFVADDAGDRAVERNGQGTDTVEASVTYALAAGIEHLTLTGTAAINGTGNRLDNTLIGNAGANVLNGSTGDDTLSGGLGDDTLIGGKGADKFVFDSLPIGAGNIDLVQGFSSSVDKVQLSKADFAALGSLGALKQGAFLSSATAVSGLEADDRIIYNSVTGNLYYDADGSGAGAAVQIATFGTTTIRPVLTFTDFEIIA